MKEVNKSKFPDFSVLKEEISQDNILAMSEMIAFFETRFLIGYMGSRMQRMYADLITDIKHKHETNYALSNGYDLVQECALYLTQHYGKHIYDIIGYTKKGKKITVQIACIKKITKLITRKWSDNYRSISVEDLLPNNEPSIEIQEETHSDYTLYDSIFENLNLTDNMRTALECRMSGLSYPEIGKILERAQSTVFEYFIKMRQRYSAIYAQ